MGTGVITIPNRSKNRLKPFQQVWFNVPRSQRVFPNRLFSKQTLRPSSILLNVV